MISLWPLRNSSPPKKAAAGVIVTFIAIMELIKEALIDLVQSEDFAPIHVKVRSASLDADDNDNQVNL